MESFASFSNHEITFFLMKMNGDVLPKFVILRADQSSCQIHLAENVLEGFQSILTCNVSPLDELHAFKSFLQQEIFLWFLLAFSIYTYSHK